MALNDDQYKNLLDTISNIQEVVDMLHKDFDDVIKEKQELAIRVGNMENEMKEVRGILNDLPANIQKQVSEETKHVTRETERLKNEIKKKKFVAFTEKWRGFSIFGIRLIKEVR